MSRKINFRKLEPPAKSARMFTRQRRSRWPANHNNGLAGFPIRIDPNTGHSLAVVDDILATVVVTQHVPSAAIAGRTLRPSFRLSRPSPYVAGIIGWVGRCDRRAQRTGSPSICVNAAPGSAACPFQRVGMPHCKWFLTKSASIDERPQTALGIISAAAGPRRPNLLLNYRCRLIGQVGQAVVGQVLEIGPDQSFFGRW